MNSLFKSFLPLVACVLLCSSSCDDNGQDCICPGDEICVNDRCYVNDWVHQLGGTTIIARNSYTANISGHLCLDTLVFFNDTTRAINQDRFGLFVARPPGVLNILSSEIPVMVGLNEYRASTVAPVCYLNGDSWYANLHFTIYPDSVLMNFKFWALDGDPAGIVDSCNILFYRKE